MNSPKFGDMAFNSTPTNHENLFGVEFDPPFEDLDADSLSPEEDEDIDVVAEEEPHHCASNYVMQTSQNPFERTVCDRKPRDLGEYLSKLRQAHYTKADSETMAFHKMHIM
jgi:hypothetical protein